MIIGTEDVIWFLLDYKKTHPKILSNLLERLSQDGLDGEIFQIGGTKRPIWKVSIGNGNVICFTIGVGYKNSEEVRIIYAGSEINCPDFIELATIAGEADNDSKSSIGIILDKKFAPKFPMNAAAKIEEEKHKLKDYLIEDLQEYVPKSTEPLYGSKFRFLSSPQSGFKSLSLQSPDDLPLRLGPRQLELLDAPRPLLIQGVAGSGKTTVIIHSAFRRIIEEGENSSVLIVVYQNSLKQFASALIASLAGGKDRVPGIEIYTYHELCDILANSVGLSNFSWANEKHLINSLRFQRKDAGISKAVTIPELLEEIRASIKGRSIDIEKPLISLKTYMSLDQNELHVSSEFKHKAYIVAKKHQEFLIERGLVDDMDAARILFSKRNHEELKKWDYVYIDEVQDYTLVQLIFMSSLAKSAESLVFAGDEHQVIHASQFSWKRVIEALKISTGMRKYHQYSLDTNYRNTVPIIDISQTVLRHRAERLKLPSPSPPITNQPIIPKPLRIKVSQQQYEELVKRLAEEIPSLGIIYPTENEVVKTKWKLKGIDFRRGFSPKSVKGLEFEVVCLLKFGKFYSDLISGRPCYSTSTEMFRFNQVYVSLTRPRKLLILIDLESKNFHLWDDPLYKGKYIEIENIDELISRASAESITSDILGWKLTAMDFERQEAFAPAAECWERAGIWNRGAICYKQIQEFDEAIRCYLMIDAFDDAAILYEQSEKYSKAAKLWEKANNWEKAAICWEKLERYESAIKAWEKTANSQREFRARAIFSEKQKDYKSAGLFWEKINNFKRAAECREELGDFEYAYNLWKKSGNKSRALIAKAKKYELEGDFENAVSFWIKLQNWQNVALSYERLKKFQEAYNYWEKTKDTTSQSLVRSIILEKEGNLSEAYEIRNVIRRGTMKNFENTIQEAKYYYRSGKRLEERLQKYSNMKIKKFKGKRNKRRRGESYKDIVTYYRNASSTWKTAADELEEVLNKFIRLGIMFKQEDRWLAKIEYARSQWTICSNLSGESK